MGVSSFGRRVQETREERGISASELARLVGVTPTAVWNWEKNGITPRSEALSMIAKVLGVTKEFLISGEIESENGSDTGPRDRTVADIIEEAKAQIASATGFSPERVKLHLELITN